jgi:hypothetical protein
MSDASSGVNPAAPKPKSKPIAPEKKLNAMRSGIAESSLILSDGFKNFIVSLSVRFSGQPEAHPKWYLFHGSPNTL